MPAKPKAPKVKRELSEKEQATHDAIAADMSNNHPNWTVDALLVQPPDALRMGVRCAAEEKRLPRAVAKRLTDAIAKLERMDNGALSVALDYIRAAMRLRKKGHLKPDRV